jgi:hypothetical protein
MLTGWGEGWGLRPSPARRGWMDDQTNAYQCLPLVMANQWGWQVLCPTEVRVTWDGTPGPDGLRVEVEPQYTPAIKSQFGSGIVTFSPPWLFRTPPGWDLYLKGPSNRWKLNCHPLEGIIETWWLNYTFTINWKLIEPGTVVFAGGESIGQLVPVPHATFEEATALEAPIGLLEPQAARELMAAHRPGGQRPSPLPQGRGGRGTPAQSRRAGDRVDLAVKDTLPPSGSPSTLRSPIAKMRVPSNPARTGFLAVTIPWEQLQEIQG